MLGKNFVLMMILVILNGSIVMAANPIKDFQIVQWPVNIIGGESYNASYSFNAQKSVSMFLSFRVARSSDFDGNEINVSSAYIDGTKLYCSEFFELNTYTFVCPPNGAEFGVGKGGHSVDAVITSNIRIEPEQLNISLGLFTENYEDYQEAEFTAEVPQTRNSLPFKCVPQECIKGRRQVKCSNPLNNLTREYSISCSEIEFADNIVGTKPSGGGGSNLTNNLYNQSDAIGDIQKEINETKKKLDEEVEESLDVKFYAKWIAIGIGLAAIIVYLLHLYKLKREVDIENDGGRIVEEIKGRKK